MFINIFVDYKIDKLRINENSNLRARQDLNLRPSASYHYSFRYQNMRFVCGLDHVFTLSGMVRMASTEP